MSSSSSSSSLPQNIYLITPPATAEDLTLSQSYRVLGIHVLHRGFTLGAGVGGLIGSIRPLVSRAPRTASPTTALAVSRWTRIRVSAHKGAARGSLVGFAAMIAALYGRMKDQDDYGWQDRSYRLLYNSGQNASDWASLGGAVANVAWKSVRLRPVGAAAGVMAVIGDAAVGSVLGSGVMAMYRGATGQM